MKKLAVVCLSWLVWCLAFAFTPVTAPAAEVHTDAGGNYEYVCNGRYAKITKYLGTIKMDEEAVYTLPSELDGYIVNEVGQGAFSVYSAPTKHLVIPDTVSAVDDKAFSYEYDDESGEYPITSGVRLESVILPESLIYLGNRAFSGNDIASAIVPGSVKYMGGACMGNSLQSLVLKEGIKEIQDLAFESCPLRSLTLPSTLTRIGDQAFYWLGLLNQEKIDLVIPDAVTEIGDKAFGFSGVLQTVKFGKGLQTIGEDAFVYCTNIKSFDTSACTSLCQIKKQAFEGCESLKSISFDSGLERLKIDEQAFYGCPALRTITVPDCTEFGKEAVGYVYSKKAESYVLTDKLKVKVISSGVFKPSKYGYGTQEAVYTLYRNTGLKANLVIKTSDTKELKFNDKAKFRLVISGNSGLKWKSSNPKVAKISSNGTVSTLTGGTTKLTTTLNDGKKYTCTLKVIKRVS